MSDVVYNNLQGAVRKSGDGERYEFGFLVNGAFVAFSSQQANGFEDDLREAQEAAQAQQGTATQQPQQ